MAHVFAYDCCCPGGQGVQRVAAGPVPGEEGEAAFLETLAAHRARHRVSHKNPLVAGAQWGI